MRRKNNKSVYVSVRSFVDALESRRLMVTASATADEESFIELINSAVANPTQYAISHGLSVSLSDATSQPPLAVNGNLQDAANFKTDETADNSYFGHVSAVTGKTANDLVRDSGYTLPSYYTAGQNYLEAHRGIFDAGRDAQRAAGR